MIDVRWYKQDKAKVAAGLEAGEQPELATTTTLGALDRLVALHEELGAFAALEGLENKRKREGIGDDLLMRTLAVLPFVGNQGFRTQTDTLFREPAILLRLGWTPVQIRSGDNERYRHPEGRQAESLPCHPDTLRDALARPPQADGERLVTGAKRGGAGAISAEPGAGECVCRGWDGVRGQPAGSGPGLRLGQPAGGGGLALSGRNGLREGAGGQRDQGVGEAGAGGRWSGLHRAAPGGCPVCGWPRLRRVGLAQV